MPRKPPFERLFVCYIPGPELRRVAEGWCPYVADLLDSCASVRLRAQGNHANLASLITGTQPHQHRLWGPRLQPDRHGRSAVEHLGDGLPDVVTTTVQGALHVPLLGSNVDRPVEVDILQGLQSYLAQPRFFDREELVDYSGAPPEARYCDDLWISAHAKAPRLVVPLSRISASHLANHARLRATSLGKNFNSTPDPEARSNSILLRHFADRWGAGW